MRVQIRQGVHFDLTCDFRAGDDVGCGMEAHIPDMLFSKIKWWLHHDLVIIINVRISFIVVPLHQYCIYYYYRHTLKKNNPHHLHLFYLPFISQFSKAIICSILMTNYFWNKFGFIKVHIYNIFMSCSAVKFKINLTLAILLLVNTWSASALPPKLPLFIGKGYDILVGNPLSGQGVDPGFQHEIFEFAYTKNETTEDGKFLVPDGISHRKTTACSFSTQITEYRGTQSYQSELKTKAVIGAGYNGSLFKASFSMSTSYDKIHNQTTKENMTLTHASAECQCYEMSVNLFKPGPISDNFWSGVSYSLGENDWQRFIEQFGTHYVYEVVMGGRATQEIQYSFKSASDMVSLDIDVNIAAKATFAKYYADASFDYHKYETQIKYAETLSQNIHEIYIGGQPPKTGKIMDWQELVINDPMPITYKMLPLSDLFSFNPDKTVDYKAAKASFLSALDLYCTQNKCKEPTPDKPKPLPANVVTGKSRDYGGGGGGPFEWSHASPTMSARKIHVRSGSEIDNIQIQLSDGVTNLLSPQFGGQGGGDRDPWEVPKDEYITQVEYRAGDRIDSLTFITNKGNKSPRYGGTGGSYFIETFPPDYKIIGMFGRDGSRLDRLGFVLGKVQYRNGQATMVKKNLILNDS